VSAVLDGAAVGGFRGGPEMEFLCKADFRGSLEEGKMEGGNDAATPKQGGMRLSCG